MGNPCHSLTIIEILQDWQSKSRPKPNIHQDTTGLILACQFALTIQMSPLVLHHYGQATSQHPNSSMSLPIQDLMSWAHQPISHWYLLFGKHDQDVFHQGTLYSMWHMKIYSNFCNRDLSILIFHAHLALISCSHSFKPWFRKIQTINQQLINVLFSLKKLFDQDLPGLFACRCGMLQIICLVFSTVFSLIGQDRWCISWHKHLPYRLSACESKLLLQQNCS